MRGRAFLAISLTLGLLTFAGAARADDWWLFSRTPRTISFIDLASLGTVDGMPVVWMRRYEHGSPRARQGQSVYEFAERWQADCAGRRVRVLEARLYSYDGQMVAEGSGDGTWIPPTEGTNTELLLQVVCDHERRELDDVAAADPVALKAMVVTGSGLPGAPAPP
jgi:hypothetical protein